MTNSSVRSGESSRDAARRRSQELSKIRERLSSGDSEHQMADELKMLPRGADQGNEVHSAHTGGPESCNEGRLVPVMEYTESNVKVTIIYNDI